jgi:leader peptidase (prepilin peptidase)/N-methyltransferase
MLPPGTGPLLEIAALAGALGLVVGSFLNVVVHRLPRGESVVRPRSHCPSCSRPIRALENIPVLSFLWLRGRCRGCGARIPIRYPLVELVTAAVFAGVVWTQGISPLTPVWLCFAAALIAAAAIDFDHHWIPDGLSLGGLAFGLAAMPAAGALAGAPYLQLLERSVLGAFLGGGTLWAVGFAHARISTALGRRFEHWPGEGEALPKPSSLDYWVWFPGLGFGDVKLLAMIGAFLGPVGVLETIFLAAVVGLVLGIGWAVVRRGFGQPFGFAPAIALAAILIVATPIRLPLF